ncbi:MAG: hypothetical protein ACTSUE_13275 [Promethearchaeota archaeon]
MAPVLGVELFVNTLNIPTLTNVSIMSLEPNNIQTFSCLGMGITFHSYINPGCDFTFAFDTDNFTRFELVLDALDLDLFLDLYLDLDVDTSSKSMSESEWPSS